MLFKDPKLVSEDQWVFYPMRYYGPPPIDEFELLCAVM